MRNEKVSSEYFADKYASIGAKNAGLCRAVNADVHVFEWALKAFYPFCLQPQTVSRRSARSERVDQFHPSQHLPVAHVLGDQHRAPCNVGAGQDQGIPVTQGVFLVQIQQEQVVLVKLQQLQM